MTEEAKSRVAVHIPNALSVARVPLSLSLLLFAPFSVPFNVLYIACGLTDALDGFLARKLHAESTLGSKLDSVADITFFASALYVFITAIRIPLVLIAWALAVTLARVCGLVAASAKFHSWPALHTVAYKAVSFAFFCFPLMYLALGVVAAGVALCLMATLATLEELYINLRSDTLDTDIRSAHRLAK